MSINNNMTFLFVLITQFLCISLALTNRKKIYVGTIIIQLLKLVGDTVDIPINSYSDDWYEILLNTRTCRFILSYNIPKTYSSSSTFYVINVQTFVFFSHQYFMKVILTKSKTYLLSSYFIYCKKKKRAFFWIDKQRN
jgi:uncharacterized membrane protein